MAISKTKTYCSFRPDFQKNYEMKDYDSRYIYPKICQKSFISYIHIQTHVSLTISSLAQHLIFFVFFFANIDKNDLQFN